MEQASYLVPKGWHLTTIGNVLSKIVTGKTPSTKNTEYYSSEEVDWYTPSDFGFGSVLGSSIRKLSYKALEDGTMKLMPKGSVLLVAIGATIGKVGLAVDESCFNQQITGIYFNENIYPKYAYYWLSYTKSEIIAKSSQATLPIINQTGIKNLSFLYPAKDEQKRIVEKLDALLSRIDTAIEHLQESITLADALSKNGLAEIFETLKSGCEVVPLSSVVKINSGIALPNIFKNGFSDGEIPFYKVAQMNNHHENMIEPEITFNEIIAKEHKIKLFPKGSTLIPKRGGAILTNKKRILLEDASYDSNIMGLKADESKISDDYLFAFMRTIDLANFVDASTIPQVNNKHIDQMQIPLASMEVQIDVVNRVKLLVKKIETMDSEIKSQLNELLALKNSILDSAFKGEL